MARLHEKPLPVRRRFARIATVCVGVVLITILVIRYTTVPVAGINPKDRLDDFYTTVIDKGQSLFDR